MRFGRPAVGEAGAAQSGNPVAPSIDPFPCRDQRLLFRRKVEWVRRCVRTPAQCAEPRCMNAIDLSAAIAAADQMLQSLSERSA